MTETYAARFWFRLAKFSLIYYALYGVQCLRFHCRSAILLNRVDSLTREIMSTMQGRENLFAISGPVNNIPIPQSTATYPVKDEQFPPEKAISLGSKRKKGKKRKGI